MKMKIALAAVAVSGSVVAFVPSSALALPASSLSQSYPSTVSDNPLFQKVHRWWRRGGWGPYYGYGYGAGYGYGYPYYRPYYPAYRPYYYGSYYAYPPPPPPPYYYYRPYWGPYY
jgi:hypothetical protein